MLQRTFCSVPASRKLGCPTLLSEIALAFRNWSRTSATMAVSKAPKGSKPRVVYWFRTDLRLHDSPALQAALDLDLEAFYPIWTWDPHYVYRARVGPNRWQFLFVVIPA
jgi:DNA photolyase